MLIKGSKNITGLLFPYWFPVWYKMVDSIVYMREIEKK
jgi:hypothetical protein